MFHAILKAPLLAGLLLAATAASAQMPDVPELPDGWSIPTITPVPGGSLSDLTADEIGGAWHYETSGHAIIACIFRSGRLSLPPVRWRSRRMMGS